MPERVRTGAPLEGVVARVYRNYRRYAVRIIFYINKTRAENWPAKLACGRVVTNSMKKKEIVPPSLSLSLAVILLLS